MTELARRSLLARARSRLHAFARSLLAAHVSPERLAAAVFVGAVAGCTPFFGLHLPLCIGVAWLLGLNQPTVYAAANISIPPMIPLLGFASVQLGERLLHHRFLALAIADFRVADLHALVTRFFLDWLVGGLFVGAGIGALMAAATYGVAHKRQKMSSGADTDGAAVAEDPVDAAIRAASRRYDAAPRPLRMYARFKYRLDPCYRRIAPLIADGTFTVDLGTGLGMLPMVLAVMPGSRRVLGVEWDEKKVRAGRAAAAGLRGLELVEGDVRSFAIPPCDVITIVDVLHYYPPDEQRELLARCAAALRPLGLLLIREGDARREGSARMTRAIESLAVRIGWNRANDAENFPAVDELRRELTRLGCTVTVEPVAGKLHPGNVLVRAQRDPA